MKTGAFLIVLGMVVVCGIFLSVFEKKQTDVRKIVLIAVMTAMSVAGRIVFAPLPGFKPVTAIVVITGIYLGVEAGFYCGSLTALITNFYFGQGPWTPFQMLLWGLTGILAALLSSRLKEDKISLSIFGLAAGILFSLCMDVYSVIWALGTWRWSMYFIMIGSSAPYTVIYGVSNVIFLLALSGPVGKKLNRIAIKYQLTM